MLTSGRFWVGVGIGVIGVSVFHRWVKPMPTNAG